VETAVVVRAVEQRALHFFFAPPSALLLDDCFSFLGFILVQVVEKGVVQKAAVLVYNRSLTVAAPLLEPMLAGGEPRP